MSTIVVLMQAVTESRRPPRADLFFLMRRFGDWEAHIAGNEGIVRVNCCKYTDQDCILPRFAVFLVLIFATQGIIAAQGFKLVGVGALPLRVGERIVEPKLRQGAFGQ